jgi:hypothetical protein
MAVCPTSSIAGTREGPRRKHRRKGPQWDFSFFLSPRRPCRGPRTSCHSSARDRRRLAEAASSLPLHVYRKADAGRERVESGSLYDLLERPGPATQADLVSPLMCHLAVYGNGYLAKYGSSAGEIVQIGLINPDRFRPELQGGEIRFRYSPERGGQQLSPPRTWSTSRASRSTAPSALARSHR